MIAPDGSQPPGMRARRATRASPPLLMVPSGESMREEEYHWVRGTGSRSPRRAASSMGTKSTEWDASKNETRRLKVAQAPQSAS